MLKWSLLEESHLQFLMETTSWRFLAIYFHILFVISFCGIKLIECSVGSLNFETIALKLFQVAAVFARNDKDGDGKLSKEEFKEMMCRDKK